MCLQDMCVPSATVQTGDMTPEDNSRKDKDCDQNENAQMDMWSDEEE